MSEGLVLSGVTAGYRNRRVVQNLSLGPVAAGRVTALVGPNAAGKSTLMQAIAGLIRSSGSIRLGSRELGPMTNAARADIAGYMPQALPQGVALTVLESVLASLNATAGIRSVKGRDNDLRRAAAVLDRLAISDIASEPLSRLSGGQRQLAGLAQALVREPALLLLDEPTSALDLRHQVTVMSMMRSIAAEGRVVVTVLHDLNLAARWADDAVVMDNGRIAAFGPIQQALRPDIVTAVYGVSVRRDELPGGRFHLYADDVVLVAPEMRTP